MDEPQGRPLVYAFSLWGPVLLGGVYGIAWSLLSNAPGAYRPVLGVLSVVFVAVSGGSIARALRQWRRGRRRSSAAPMHQPTFWGSGLSGRAKWIRVTGQAGMILGGFGLAASFRSLIDERKELALLLVLASVTLLALGGFLYWMSNRVAARRKQASRLDAVSAPSFTDRPSS